MAISDSQKVDFLWKKIGTGIAKTDVPSKKDYFNERIPSPLLVRGDTVWTNASQIPPIIPVQSTDVITLHSASSPVPCLEDTTSQDNRTWLTNYVDWIPTEFGPTYQVKAYVADVGDLDPVANGTQLPATGTGNDDEWFFDYKAGILHFIGENLPADLATGTSGKRVYIVGARYVGALGTGLSALSDDASPTLTASLNTGGNSIISPTDTDIILSPGGEGSIILDASTITLPSGTDAERPSNPGEGMIRFNSISQQVEYYNGTEWINLGEDAAIIESQTILGDGSTAVFTLLRNTTAENIIVSINGTLQNPGTAYTVTQDQLTFSEPPGPNDVVDVRHITLTYTFDRVVFPHLSRLEALSISNKSVGLTYYVTDGDPNTGGPCLATWDGSKWLTVSYQSDLANSPPFEINNLILDGGAF